jgi:HEAT repeat protein
MRHVPAWFFAILLAFTSFGCHASPDDPAGQAKELNDAARRRNALQNLTRIYSQVLGDNDGNPDAAPVRAMVDASIENVVSAYKEAHDRDKEAALGILELLKNMRDPRALDAYLVALDWEQDMTEDHAVAGAKGISRITVPKERVPEVVKALEKALKKAPGRPESRIPKDVRIMDATLRALGSLKDPAATNALVSIMSEPSDDKFEGYFLIRRLAAMQLASHPDPAAVAALIEALFYFDGKNPALRMEDVAIGTLVAIGKPSLQALLDLYDGKNQKANQLADAFGKKVNMKGTDYAKRLAVQALGVLGLPAGLRPIFEQAAAEEADVRMNAAIALARVNASGDDEKKQRETLMGIYNKLGTDVPSIMMKGQLLAVFQHTMDPTFMPLFLAEVRDTKQELPVLRIGANSAYAFLANKAEAATLREIISAEKSNVDGGNKKELEAALPALNAAKECDENVQCWKGKLADKDTLVRRKAAYMLGRLVENDASVIAALVEVLGDPEITVRNAALFALDRVALKGSPEAVAKIEDLLQKEQGTVMGKNFSTEAVGIAGRLQARHGA